jgi:hypothetical protein
MIKIIEITIVLELLNSKESEWIIFIFGSISCLEVGMIP